MEAGDVIIATQGQQFSRLKVAAQDSPEIVTLALQEGLLQAIDCDKWHERWEGALETKTAKEFAAFVNLICYDEGRSRAR